MPPPIPKPTIYLRDKFLIKTGLHGAFFKGQKELLQHAKGKMTLIAGCSRQRVIAGSPFPVKPPDMLHIWKLGDWDSLYELMYTFSETDWYASEVSSLSIEHQDLLIGIGHGIEVAQRPEQWGDERDPGYVYLYDEVRLFP